MVMEIMTDGKERLTENTTAPSGSIGMGTVQDDFSRRGQDARSERAASASDAPKASHFLGLALTLSANTPLSTEGEVFFKMVSDTLEKNGVKVHRLPSTNAYIVSNGELAIGLCFEEQIGRDALRSGFGEMRMRVESEYNKMPEIAGGDIIDTHLVTKDDYPRADRWANYLVNALRYGMGDALTFRQLMDCKFRITTNSHSVRSALEALSPHRIPSRVDFGVVIEILNETDSEFRPRSRNNDDRNSDYRTIGVVGGYTDFIKTYTGRGREARPQPVIHITEILSLVPTLKMLPVFLVMALDYCYNQNGWRAPFAQFGPNSPNLGNLFFNDETGKPEVVNSLDVLRGLCDSELEEPLVVVDITPGRVSLPGLWLMADPRTQENVVAHLADFFGSKNILSNGLVFSDAPWPMLTGIVNIAGDYVDTRYVDYFRVIKTSSDRQLLDHFLGYDSFTETRIKDIEAAGFPDYRVMYETQLCTLNPHVLSELIGEVSNLCVVTDYQDTTRTIGGLRLLETSREFGEVFRSQGAMFRRTQSRSPFWTSTNVFR